MFNRVMTKDNIAVVTLLEHRASGARLIVANAHIHWDPEFRDVKLVQVAMLMEELNKIANDFARLPARINLAEGYDKAPHYSTGSKIPTIICGDFNSVPDSGVYDFMSSGHVEKNHDDFMDHVYGEYAIKGASHNFKLKSAYSHVNELPFTNFTPGFKGESTGIHVFVPRIELRPDALEVQARSIMSGTRPRRSACKACSATSTPSTSRRRSASRTATSRRTTFPS